MCPTNFPIWMFPAGVVIGALISAAVIRMFGRAGAYLLIAAAFVMAVVVVFSLGKLKAAGCLS